MAKAQRIDGRGGKRRDFLVGVARGIAGALLFALPMLMTMEMWELGFYIDRRKLLLLLLLNLPLLVVLAHRLGFEHTATWREAVRDTAAAYGIGIFTSAFFLALFGIIRFGMPLDETLGKIAIQSVPASIGALLGRSQLGGSGSEDSRDEEESGDDGQPLETGYATELFMMAIGALFIALNVAPTEEMILVSYKMTYWHALAAILVSIAMMHAFVYAMSFQGGHELSPHTPWWHALVRFTLPGYVVALAISLYALWTFERLSGAPPLTIAMAVIVLSLPGALGAAAARLIL